MDLVPGISFRITHIIFRETPLLNIKVHLFIVKNGRLSRWYPRESFQYAFYFVISNYSEKEQGTEPNLFKFPLLQFCFSFHLLCAGCELRLGFSQLIWKASFILSL